MIAAQSTRRSSGGISTDGRGGRPYSVGTCAWRRGRRPRDVHDRQPVLQPKAVAAHGRPRALDEHERQAPQRPRIAEAEPGRRLDRSAERRVVHDEQAAARHRSLLARTEDREAPAGSGTDR
jgi:hypothetical protein